MVILLLRLHFSRRRCDSGNLFSASSINVDHVSLSSYLNTHDVSFKPLFHPLLMFLSEGENHFKRRLPQLGSFIISKVLRVYSILAWCTILTALTHLPACITTIFLAYFLHRKTEFSSIALINYYPTFISDRKTVPVTFARYARIILMAYVPTFSKVTLGLSKQKDRTGLVMSQIAQTASIEAPFLIFSAAVIETLLSLISGKF